MTGLILSASLFVFLELSCSFDDPVDVGNLISGSSAFSKTTLNIWKFTVHVLLKPGLENSEHYFTNMCGLPTVCQELTCIIFSGLNYDSIFAFILYYWTYL